MCLPGRPGLAASARDAEEHRMNVQAAAAMQLQAQTLDAARASIANAQQTSAAQGAAAQPAVILELSAAAQALTGG